MDGVTLYAVNNEVRDKLPLRIQKIGALSKNDILIAVFGRDFRGQLLLSLGSPPFFGFVDGKGKGLLRPSNFCMRLRKHLEGGTLLSTEQEGLDRVLCLTAGGRDDFGDRQTYTLVLDLAGRRGNLGFFDPEGNLLSSLRPPDGERFSSGKPYVAPEDKGINLLTAKGKIPPGALQGVGRELSRALALGGEGARGRLRDVLLEKSFAPALYRGKGGLLFHIFPLPHLELLETFQCVTEGAREYRSAFLEEDLRKHLQSFGNKVYRRVSRKLRSTHQAQSLQMEETQGMNKYRVFAELIYSFGVDFPPGRKSVTLQNYYEDPPAPTDIPLDPKLSARDNAAAYYRKYNKLARTKKTLEGSLGRLEASLDELRLLGESLAGAENSEELSEIVSFLETFEQKVLKKRAERKKAPKDEKKPSSWRFPGVLKIPGPDGTTLFVGKSAGANDYLATRIKRKGDVWLHVKGEKGAHALVRPGKQGEISDRALQEGALLAAGHSKLSSGKVEVDAAPAQHVKKVKGAAPGFVTYSHHRTLVVEVP